MTFKTIIMNYLKAIQEISEIIPNIEEELEEKKIQSSYSVINAFTNRIKTMIVQKERNLLFKSLKKMNDIYRNEDVMLNMRLSVLSFILWTILPLFAAPNIVN